MEARTAVHPLADLNAYIDGALDPQSRDRVDAHLGSCATCSMRVAELRATAKLIAALPAPAPARSLVPRIAVPMWLAPLRTASAVASGLALVVFVISLGSGFARQTSGAAAPAPQLNDRTGAAASGQPALAPAPFGFASILLKSLEQTTPQHIAAAFDLPQPTFRHEREATYKATRRPMPDELRPQLERCKQLLEKFGIPMYSLPGYEADDVIGALARQAEAKGLETIIVSGDLDPLQLVSPLIKLMTTRQGFQNTVIYDEELIRQRYGLRPDQMVDFKALKGDATDNIPGVPGVGEKTAAKLVAEHANLDGVYADLGPYTPRLREALAANKDQVYRSRELATIVTELPVTLELDRTRRSTYDRAAVLDLFRDLEFRSLVPRLPPADQHVAASLPARPQTAVRGGHMQLGLATPPPTTPAAPPALVR